MMSESFEPNNTRFDRFGEDLRLSLNDSGPTTTMTTGGGGGGNNISTHNNSHISPSISNNDQQSAAISPTMGNSNAPGNFRGEQQQLYDRRGSGGGIDGNVAGGLGGAVCGSSLSQLANAQSKIDSLKTWGVSAYKCTRQAISERLGKVTRTVDAEMEQNIVTLRESQVRYEQLLTLARSLLAHFHQLQVAQQSLGECLQDFATQEPEMRDEYMKNAETQRLIASNGGGLEAALNFFISTLSTMCQKTMEDTMLTVRNYETARLEYDAYRIDFDTITQAPVRGSDHQSRSMEAEHSLLQHKQRYEQLRDDVQVKMRFLQENKVKVMKKQLLLLNNATTAYFSGNQKALETALQQFNLKPLASSSSSSSTNPSWLES